MTQMPSQADLANAVNQIFQLQDDHGAVAQVQLLSVEAGVSMGPDYTCYAAVFAMPAGMAASQGTYRLSRDDAAWSLFMAPIRTDAAGRARLEAVFHYRMSTAGDRSRGS
jgi:hypothetical protein